MQREERGAREIARSDRVTDYMQEDFTNDSETYDFIFDAVGKLSSTGAEVRWSQAEFTRDQSELYPLNYSVYGEIGYTG